MYLPDILNGAKGVKSPFNFRALSTKDLSPRLDLCYKPFSLTLPEYLERPNIPNITDFTHGKFRATALGIEGAFMRSNIRNVTSCHRIDRVYPEYAGNLVYATHKAVTTVVVTTGSHEGYDGYYNLTDVYPNDYDEHATLETVFGNVQASQKLTGTPVMAFNMILGYTDTDADTVIPSVLIFRPYGDIVSPANQAFFWAYVAHVQSLGVKVLLLSSSAEWVRNLFAQLPSYKDTYSRVLFRSMNGKVFNFNEVAYTPRFYPDGNVEFKHNVASGDAWFEATAQVVPNIYPSTKNYTQIIADTSIRSYVRNSLATKVPMFSRSTLTTERGSSMYLIHESLLKENVTHVKLGHNLCLADSSGIRTNKLDMIGVTYLDWYVHGMMFNRALEVHAEPRLKIAFPFAGDAFKLQSVIGKLSFTRSQYANMEAFGNEAKLIWDSLCKATGVKDYSTVVKVQPSVVPDRGKYRVDESLYKDFFNGNAVKKPKLKPKPMNWDAELLDRVFQQINANNNEDDEVVL